MHDDDDGVDQCFDEDSMDDQLFNDKGNQCLLEAHAVSHQHDQ